MHAYGCRLSIHRCGTPSYCAPELLSGEGYGKAVDLWSIGVLTYVVLCGELPFVANDRHELFRLIKKGSYAYAEPHAPSELARDFISRMLRLAPMERYSTRETLQHPWLNDAVGECGEEGGGGEVPESLHTVHEMMRRFNAEQKLKRVFLTVLAVGRFRRAGRHGFLSWAPGAPWLSARDSEPGGEEDGGGEGGRVRASPVPSDDDDERGSAGSAAGSVHGSAPLSLEGSIRGGSQAALSLRDSPTPARRGVGDGEGAGFEG